ncbi:MAG: glucokinase [Gammaproteobacteria bacterium]|nr:glucokinase [Gammaproteobacteria bacterium]
MWILIGDIGGTNTRLQLVETVDRKIDYHARISYPSQNYKNLATIVKHFIEQTESNITIDAACFAVAGPVKGSSASVTNLPWDLNAEELKMELQIPQIFLINDFQAIGYGISALEENDIVTLQHGKPVQHGHMALIGAGTGLGETLLTWRESHYVPLPTEGGHVDFSPADELQMELLQYLKLNHTHVSYEMVLSGPGLINIYTFLRDSKKISPSREFTERLENEDLPALITEYALSGKDELAVQTLDCFIKIYGAQAGNVALSYLATGGVYIAGGIAPKIISKFSEGSFLTAFNQKGKMANLVRDIPVKVVLNEHVGLLGALQYVLLNQ